MINPLLESFKLPPFTKIKTNHIEPAVDQLLKKSKAAVISILTEQPDEITWGSLQARLDEIEDRFNKAWSPVSHMNAVVNSETLRTAYNNCLPKLSDYSTWYSQNSALFKAYEKLANSESFKKLTTAQKQVIKHILRNFKLSGVSLSEEKKKRFKAISKTLSELGSRFSDNVLDATMAWSKHIEDKSALDGLPESALEQAHALAKAKGLTGWLLNLEYPSYFPVITYCKNRVLRREMYEAYCTRASDQGPYANQFNNSDIINQILKLRHELAQLLNFQNYAEYSLATKMAATPQEVISFLEDMAKRCKPQAEKELSELKAFAQQQLDYTSLESWDIAYYSEKLRESRYALNQEALRPWFLIDKVLEGFFEVVNRLFGVHFAVNDTLETWHKDVRCYDLIKNDELIAQCYIDLYSREHKRGGAWMDECQVRRIRSDNTLQLPVAYLTTNFTPPIDKKPALLTHDEVLTLFHEFGHGLHHMLTKIEVADVSGINGVAWDAVELPSQFMENWCWQKEALTLISGHFETGEPLSEKILDKLLASKNFQAAMMLVRQLEFSLFDFKLHQAAGEPDLNVQALLDDIRSQVAVVTPPSFNRFQHSFSHIFSGGYAAGYYSYLWAEVLSADAFSLFKENGVFDSQTGEAFLNKILEKGGSEEPMDLFVAFRGRKPTIDAFLIHSGIA